MEIAKTDNLAFKTNIKCVSPRFFNRKTMNMFCSKEGCNIISRFDIDPIEHLKECTGYRINTRQCYTEKVRTCTAGVVVDKGKKAPLFIHVSNSRRNKRDANLLQKFFHGTNAILIGSKDMFSYSRAVFDKFKNFALSKKLPLTMMQGLDRKWQANLAYNSDEDTLYLCVNNAAKESEYVKNMKELKQIFRKVEISPTDNIEFVNRFKQFLFVIGFPF